MTHTFKMNQAMSTSSNINDSIAYAPDLLNSKLLILSSVLFRLCRHQKSSEEATHIYFLWRGCWPPDIKLSSDPNLSIVHFWGLYTIYHKFINKFWCESSFPPFFGKTMILKEPISPKKTKQKIKWSLSHRIMLCDNHYRWGHARKYLKSCLSVYFPSFCASWVVD